MRYLLTIILLLGCADAPQVSPLALQLREAQEVPEVEPLQPNTEAIETLKELVNTISNPEPSEVGSAVEQSSEGDTRRPPPIVEAPAEPLQTPTCTIQQVAQSSGPLLTLYTTDGSFPCGGCEIQQRIIAESNIADGLISIVLVDGATASSLGGVPRWETYDKTTRASGVMKAGQLVAWLEMLAEHRGDRAMAFADVKHCEPTLDAVMAALACHLSEDAGKQAFGSLINVDVDLPDATTKAVFEILATGKLAYPAAGVAFEWSATSRQITAVGKKITFTPPAKITVSKWLARWTAALTAVEWDAVAKSVTLHLSGAPDLTVRFK
jgi:hypothetical protein